MNQAKRKKFTRINEMLESLAAITDKQDALKTLKAANKRLDDFYEDECDALLQMPESKRGTYHEQNQETVIRSLYSAMDNTAAIIEQCEKDGGDAFDYAQFEKMIALSVETFKFYLKWL